MAKIVWHWITFWVILAIAVGFPPFWVVLIGFVIWRSRAARRGYARGVAEGNAQQAQYARHAVLEHRRRVAKSFS